MHRSRPDDLGKFTVPLYAWEGEGVSEWVKDESGESACLFTLHDNLRKIGGLVPQMRLLCTLVADLSKLRTLLKKSKAANGSSYWAVNFTVAIMFGGTQLHAKLKWMEGVSTLDIVGYILVF